MSIFNYTLLSQFRESRLGSKVIGFDDLRKEMNLEYENGEYHCWIVNKDKRIYLMLNEHIKKLPIKIKDTQIIKERTNIYHMITRFASIGFS